MHEKSLRAMRRAGGWNIVFGIAAITAGIALGVGNLIAGGSLLKNSR